ncbi:unnamed protein product [Spirodela intermedia]|uniref:Uncharacterized protein n=1 Tax=Spirodela intermedia TaxID=51605 RepID=A0A7I8IYN2_SPIIN|nr:unnamed protein product [Spirodela intermedia]CAA6662997.1 unnamed protein product [Spirodela intermedia]
MGKQRSDARHAPNLKERTKGRSRLSGVYAQVSQQPDLPLDKENLPQGIPTFHNQGEPDKTLFGNPPPAENNKVASPKEVAEVLRDITDQSGNEDTSRHAKEREGMATDVRRATKGTDSTAKPKQGTREDPASDSYEKTNLASHRPVRTKGKVKESVKNFEARKLGLRENMKGRVEDRPSAQEVKEDEDKGNYEASSVPVAPAGQNLKAERADSFKNLGEQKLDGFFSEMDSTSVTFSDTTINSLDAFFCKIEVTDFEHVEDCLVLWPGSGWKPVPLVDIIEAPSVRRAYQRALLYIHPDKLQQKGADIHRK